MDKIRIRFGGMTREYPRGTPVKEAIPGRGLYSFDEGGPALAAKINGRLVDLDRPLAEDGELELVTFDTPEGKAVYRHSVAHILAQAVKRLYPSARLAIGPAIEDGFYYDFDVAGGFSPEDLERIQEEMSRIVAENLPIRREEVSREEALRIFEELQEPYKLEMIRELPEGEPISLYRQGEFVDLCAGPHLPSTGEVKAFKLTGLAGAYWRGDERQPMLQRVYGTAFLREEDLEAYLARLEEARRRDHRRLGRELDLFSIQEEAGPGLVFWHPRGALVRQIIEDFWRQVHRERGYDIVYTPHIARIHLWETSGHLAWYRENMYSPMEVEGVEYLLKPMNCPFHILMYKSAIRSYRELPLRWAELGTVYRYERSGVLHGLLRVRGFTQDDAHIFCRPEQLKEEIIGVIDLARYMMESFGFKQYEMMLSVRDPKNKGKYVGNDEVWEAAENALRDALETMGLDYVLGEGEAKFYGPAIDITLKDALGRGWQGPTIQVDFNEPERFDVAYVGEDGKEHRPVMIHRTVLGSMERFLGSLIEHYAGAFPTWLAPVQARILPIADRHHPYAREVHGQLRQAGLRAEVDTRNEKVGYKIRQGQLEKIPYLLVVGDREVEQKLVAVRRRGEGDLGAMPVPDFLEKIAQEIKKKS